ncbi:hypothetical protein EDD11_008529 [Mortierella claussenii]|nr:hypothetical protein EDD11_008529 [Mortierella claussenii]
MTESAPSDLTRVRGDETAQVVAANSSTTATTTTTLTEDIEMEVEVDFGLDVDTLQEQGQQDASIPAIKALQKEERWKQEEEEEEGKEEEKESHRRQQQRELEEEEEVDELASPSSDLIAELEGLVEESAVESSNAPSSNSTVATFATAINNGVADGTDITTRTQRTPTRETSPYTESRRVRRQAPYHLPSKSESASAPSPSRKKKNQQQPKPDHVKLLLESVLPEGSMVTEDTLDRLSNAFKAIIKEASEASANKVATSVKAVATTAASKAAAAAVAALPASASAPPSVSSAVSTSGSITTSKAKTKPTPSHASSSPMSPKVTKKGSSPIASSRGSGRLSRASLGVRSPVTISKEPTGTTIKASSDRRKTSDIVSKKPRPISVPVRLHPTRELITMDQAAEAAEESGADEPEQGTIKDNQQYEENKEDDHDDQEDEYEVEAILDHRTRGDKTKYRLKWAGYPISQATWETEEALHGCWELLKEYAKAKGLQL